MALTRAEIARRIARELPSGCYVNLGVGIPTLVANYLPADREVMIQTENGILGMGPAPDPGAEDPDLINAGKQPVTIVPGGSTFDQSISFAMLRGGKVNVAVMGAYQVSQRGDLANWRLPGRGLAGVGGAADIAVGVPNIFVAMSHVTDEGEPKIVADCTFPLTARRVVKRIFTDLAVIDVTSDGLVLVEVAPGVSPEAVQQQTAAPLFISPALTQIRT